MAVRLSDAETEKLVVERGVLSPERLAPFLAQAAATSTPLYEFLCIAGLIPPSLQAELEQGGSGSPSSTAQPSAQPAAAPASSPRLVIRPPSSMAPRPPAVNLADAARRPLRPQGLNAAHPPSMPRPPAASQPFRPPPAHAPAAPQPAQVREAPAAAAPARIAEPVAIVAPAAPARPVPAASGPPIEEFLSAARQAGASDLFLSPGAPPVLRIVGEQRGMDGLPIIPPEQMPGVVRQMFSPQQYHLLDERGELTIGHIDGGGHRYRVTVLKHSRGQDICVRLAAAPLMPLEQLGLPAQCAKLPAYNEGIVLISGAAGSGKTTTMMAMVDAFNQAHNGHIVTLEDPIEYVLEPRACQISQREISTHTGDFEAAVQAALCEDPDVVVIGELRNEQAVCAALSASEAGLLVFATVQAPDCAQAIDRICESADDNASLRGRIADALRMVLSQLLLPRADGKSRMAACELLINSISVSNIIREGKTQSLVNVMQTGKSQGMLMLDECLKGYVAEKLVTEEAALMRCKNRLAFMKHLEEAQPAENAPAPEAPKPAPGASPRK
ncbi:MAG TPA: ATPase, T2SS/T4P/T4SS family [Planctomycetota bacterium]